MKGMNCRMLPRLPCSKQSTHSSMNHWTNWVCVPAVLAPRIEEISRKRFAGEEGRRMSICSLRISSGLAKGWEVPSAPGDRGLLPRGWGAPCSPVHGHPLYQGS